MSEVLNGSPRRKPRLAVDNALAVAVAERLDRHIEAEAAKEEKTNERLQKIETTLTEMAGGLSELTGQVKLFTGLFAKQRETENGPELVWHIPKPSFKTVMTLIGSASGIVIFLKFLFDAFGWFVQWIGTHAG